MPAPVTVDLILTLTTGREVTYHGVSPDNAEELAAKLERPDADDAAVRFNFTVPNVGNKRHVAVVRPSAVAALAMRFDGRP